MFIPSFQILPMNERTNSRDHTFLWAKCSSLLPSLRYDIEWNILWDQVILLILYQPKSTSKHHNFQRILKNTFFPLRLKFISIGNIFIKYCDDSSILMIKLLSNTDWIIVSRCLCYFKFRYNESRWMRCITYYCTAKECWCRSPITYIIRFTFFHSFLDQNLITCFHWMNQNSN